MLGYSSWLLMRAESSIATGSNCIFPDALSVSWYVRKDIWLFCKLTRDRSILGTAFFTLAG